MQSVFNRGECMMHVDKNADDHVMDKMWTESRGKLPTYHLVGGSGPNVVHACKFFIIIFFNKYKIYLPGGRPILAHVFRGLGFWGFGSCFQRTKGSGSWLMFSKT